MTAVSGDVPGRWEPPAAAGSAPAVPASVLFARSFVLLDKDRRALKRSRSLVERSRALCASVDQRWPARPAMVAVPAWHRETPRDVAPAASRICARTGCGQPAILQPWFVVDMGGRRVVIGNTALRVCADHRDDLGSLFADATTADELRARLAESARSRLRSVRVMFEVVG